VQRLSHVVDEVF